MFHIWPEITKDISAVITRAAKGSPRKTALFLWLAYPIDIGTWEDLEIGGHYKKGLVVAAIRWWSANISTCPNNNPLPLQSTPRAGNILARVLPQGPWQSDLGGDFFFILLPCCHGTNNDHVRTPGPQWMKTSLTILRYVFVYKMKQVWSHVCFCLPLFFSSSLHKLLFSLHSTSSFMELNWDFQNKFNSTHSKEGCKFPPINF